MSPSTPITTPVEPPRLGTPERTQAPPNPAPPLPPLPPLPKREPKAQDITPPSPPAPPKPHQPAASSFLPLGTEQTADGDDPLLRLLRTDEELLPEFLRERGDDDSISDAGPYIPALPTSLEGDSELNLTIVPFGSQANKKKPDEDDDEESAPFIPQMPDL